MNNRKLPLLCCLILSAISFLNNRVAAQNPAAQNDLFAVLEGSCNNYLDVAANDRVNGQAFQLTIVSPPSHGTASAGSSNVTYCADSGYTGSDFFTYLLLVGGNSTTATVYVNVQAANNYIFAGDADQNGRVENFDVLALGLAYNLKGPARANEVAVNALAWPPSIYTNNNPGAADCNGDGLINYTDLSVIENSYHDTFPYPPYFSVDTSPCLNGMPLYLESLTGDSVNDGTPLELAIKLGETFSPHEVYGIALTLEYDPNFIAGNQVSFVTSSSWLLQNDTGLFFSRSIQPAGEIEIALTKIDHTNASGGGEALRARLPIDDNIDGIISGPGWHPLNLKIKKARIISAYNVLQPVCIQQPAVMVYKTAIGLPAENKLTRISVYPNPANDKLTIEADGIRALELSDLTGRHLYTLQTTAINKTEINLRQLNLPAGSYLIKVQTNEFAGTRKIFVQH